MVDKKSVNYYKNLVHTKSFEKRVNRNENSLILTAEMMST